MSEVWAIGALLLAGFVLAAFAQWRRWSPPLSVAVAVAVVLRGSVLVLSQARHWQPYDYAHDFPAAAAAVLHHQDPLEAVRAGGWHFLPPMAYVYAGIARLSDVTGIGWTALGRVVPVAADIVTVVLIGRLVSSSAGLRRLQYACNPLAILVCAVHGQLEPVALALGVAAVAEAQRRREYAAGGWLGAAIAVNSWPALLLPAVLVALRRRSAQVRALLATAVLPLLAWVSIPLATSGGFGVIGRSLHELLSVRPVTGEWGWTAVASTVRGTADYLVVSGSWQRIGTVLTIAGLCFAAVRWRRADAVTVAAVVPVIFLACTARFGTQYLLWPVPFLIARPTRWTGPALLALSAWAGAGYLWLTTFTSGGYWPAHQWWALSSVAVIPLMLLALPPGTRDASRRMPPRRVRELLRSGSSSA